VVSSGSSVCTFWEDGVCDGDAGNISDSSGEINREYLSAGPLLSILVLKLHFVPVSSRCYNVEGIFFYRFMLITFFCRLTLDVKVLVRPSGIIKRGLHDSALFPPLPSALRTFLGVFCGTRLVRVLPSSTCASYENN